MSSIIPCETCKGEKYITVLTDKLTCGAYTTFCPECRPKYVEQRKAEIALLPESDEDEECEHEFDPEEGYMCLNCGKEGFEEMASAAEAYWDSREDR